MRRVSFITLVLAAACGSVEPVAPSIDGGAAVPDAAADAGIDGSVDASLYPAGVTKIVVTWIGGGPLPPAPDGSTCQPANDTYTIVLPGRVISWKVCDWGDGGPRSFVTGDRTLSESEYANVEAALRALAPSVSELCGFDKPTGAVTLTTADVEVTYHDDFYACKREPGKTFVTGFDVLFGVVTQYAR